MLKDFRSLFYIFLPIILVIALTNYMVDPGNFFNNRSIDYDIATALKANYNAAFADTMSQVDEVYIAKSIIKSFTAPKDVIALGSSRSFPVSKESFPNQSFYNLSFSSGKIEDILGIYQYLLDNNFKPKTIVLEISPEQLYLNGLPKESLYNEFVKMTYNLGLEPASKQEIFLQKLQFKMRKLNVLFSPIYFQDSLRFVYVVYQLLKGDYHPKKNTEDKELNITKQVWLPTQAVRAKGGVIFPDGSRQWQEEQLNRTEKEKQIFITQEMNTIEILKLNKPQILLERTRLLESFLAYLHQQQIEVILFLPPEHPTLYELELKFFDKSPAIMTEEYLIGLAQKYQFKVVGSLNTQNLPAYNHTWLVDHHHPTREATKLMFEQAL